MLFISLLVLLVLFLFIYIVNSIYLVFDHGSVISVACFFWITNMAYILRVFLLFSSLAHVPCGDFPFPMF